MQTIAHIIWVLLAAFFLLIYLYVASYMIVSAILTAWENHIRKKISTNQKSKNNGKKII